MILVEGVIYVKIVDLIFYVHMSKAFFVNTKGPRMLISFKIVRFQQHLQHA